MFSNSRGEKQSLVMTAAEKGEFSIVKLLHEWGADIFTDNDGFTVAAAAAAQSNFTILRMLEQGDAPQGYWTKTFPMKFTDQANTGWILGRACTLLHNAVLSRDAPMVQHLLDRGLGLDVSAPSEYGWTPLHVAAMRGNVGVIRALIKCGADINRRDKNGFLPLDRALKMPNLEIARALLEAGSMRTSRSSLMVRQVTVLKDLNESVSQGWHALQPGFDLESAILAGDLNKCKTIIDQGCSVDTPLPLCLGCPPLFAAVRANKPRIALWLISRGANPEKGSCGGLHEALWGVAALATHHLGSMECLEQLLTYILGLGINEFSRAYHPLHVAVLDKNIPALKTIILHIRNHEEAYRYVTFPNLSPVLVISPVQVLSY